MKTRKLNLEYLDRVFISFLFEEISLSSIRKQTKNTANVLEGKTIGRIKTEFKMKITSETEVKRGAKAWLVLIGGIKSDE